ncbi:MAG: tol-pal system protein YbgF [Pseudomonadota bacterium]
MQKATTLSAVSLVTALVAGGHTLPAVAQPSGSNDAVMLLYNQFSDMQEELADLRSMVEEQANEIRRLQRNTRDRYTDLDSRISQLYQDREAGSAQQPPATVSDSPLPSALPGQDAAGPNGNASGNGTSGSGQSVAGSGTMDNDTDNELLPDPAGMTEQQLYQFALDTLLQNEDYQLSTDAFDLYLQEYPDGRYVTNAWYWKGQALINLSMLEEARDAFEVIVNDYPDGRKIEDAMYSLGTVYGQLGDEARARQLLQQVMSRFPNTSAANLADIYLRSLN